MTGEPEIRIETPKEKKDKLIQWYGWITIIVLCLTPIVFVLLPIIMVNTSKINRMLKESRIPEENALAGMVKKCNWDLKNEHGVESIAGEFKIQNNQGDIINCTFLKYVGKNSKTLPYIEEGDKLEITGQVRYSNKQFAIRNIRNVSRNAIYTSEPTLSVY